MNGSVAFGYPLGMTYGSHGTNQAAQVAPHTLGPVDLRAMVVAESDCLMSAVGAGDVAPSTTDALVAVDHRVLLCKA